MTPLERLSAVRSEVKQADTLLLSLLALLLFVSSETPTMARDKPTTRSKADRFSFCASGYDITAASLSSQIVVLFFTDELWVLATSLALCVHV